MGLTGSAGFKNPHTACSPIEERLLLESSAGLRIVAQDCALSACMTPEFHPWQYLNTAWWNEQSQHSGSRDTRIKVILGHKESSMPAWTM